MSTESDYNSPSLHLPFALLTVALAVVMLAQTTATFKQRTALRDTKAQLADAYRNREPLVKQSGEIQQKLEGMVLDLLKLAQTDEDAKAIVAKYNIQQGAAAGTETRAP